MERILTFIVTPSATMMARSLAFVVAGDQVVSSTPGALKAIGKGCLFNVPIPFLMALLCHAHGWFVLTRTAFGKRACVVTENKMVALIAFTPSTGSRSTA